jgi:hypothetical protein
MLLQADSTFNEIRDIVKNGERWYMEVAIELGWRTSNSVSALGRGLVLFDSKVSEVMFGLYVTCHTSMQARALA